MSRQAALPPTLAPRLINREAAAAYVNVSPNTFDEMGEVGRTIIRPEMLQTGHYFRNPSFTAASLTRGRSAQGGTASSLRRLDIQENC